mmetsp:Transcript_41909/g.82278  ORF Transcript_41909/g.82278 Transcript_41909/m.82278 type:complete len:82 (+) Transcript_41909:137-382(+)
MHNIKFCALGELTLGAEPLEVLTGAFDTALCSNHNTARATTQQIALRLVEAASARKGPGCLACSAMDYIYLLVILLPSRMQ